MTSRRSSGIAVPWLFALMLTAGCVQAVPQDVVDAIETIDQSLIALGAPEVAASDYAHFARQWIPLKARAQSEDDLIRWPWESSDIEAELRHLEQEGRRTVSRLSDQREVQRRTAHTKLVHLEERLQLIASQVDAIQGRLVLGEQPVQTDILIKQAKSFYEQKDYGRSILASEGASQTLFAQADALSRELSRYADRKRIAAWQLLAKQTIEWSRAHRSGAIVVSKADRILTLYKDGQKVLSYPVRLGFNGIREKRYQGDGATPEGRYHVVARRGEGQTQFYRALVLDYPNSEDRRRFDLARKAGIIARSKSIGGQIEIHGAENELMAQTLGCIMLDNRHMLALYDRVEPGIPVVIVGALTEYNRIALVLERLVHHEDET
jgi:lipoprotein-anchoring transpeptidase ErfK/SrfK